MIKNKTSIFFDLDDTLVDNKGAQKRSIYTTLNSFFKGLEYSKKTIGENWQAISNYYYDLYFKGVINLETQRKNRITQLCSDFNLKIDEVDISSFYNEYYNVYLEECITFSDVANCLNHFKNYNLGIISNGLYEIQRTKLKNNSIEDFFDFIITSDNIGINKPDKRIFEAAAAQVADSTCFYIGDLFEIDAKGALDAGFNSIWLNRDNLKIDNPDRRIHIINTLKDLPSLIENIL